MKSNRFHEITSLGMMKLKAELFDYLTRLDLRESGQPLTREQQEFLNRGMASVFAVLMQHIIDMAITLGFTREYTWEAFDRCWTYHKNGEIRMRQMTTDELLEHRERPFQPPTRGN